MKPMVLQFSLIFTRTFYRVTVLSLTTSRTKAALCWSVTMFPL
jgi:hypothetical protein